MMKLLVIKEKMNHLRIGVYNTDAGTHSFLDVVIV